MPAYNASETIGETLSSVSAQTHRNFEVIVVDDGSTDDTIGAVRRHMQQDPRIRLLTQANAGVASARNHALSVATGMYVAPVDADDLWRPNKLSSQLHAMKCSRFSLVYTWYAVIDEKSVVQSIQRPSHSGQVLRWLFQGNFIGHASSPLMRTEDVVRVGGYDPTLRDRGAQGCEDWKLYLKLGEIGQFAVIEAPLTGYRVTSRSMSGDIVRMLHSHRMVMSEFLGLYSDHHRDLRLGEQRITKYYLKKALSSSNHKAISNELLRICRRNPVLALHLIRAVSRMVASRVQRFEDHEEVVDPIGTHFLSSSFMLDEKAQSRFYAVA
ncbi:MAG: glycosyltransferase family 2 protein [Janthinobacterium lividum]